MLIPLGNRYGDFMVLYWPELLRELQEKRQFSRAAKLIRQWGRDGRVIGVTDNENHIGRRLLVVDEPIPEHLAKHCQVEYTIAAFPVQGIGYYTDIYWMFPPKAQKREDHSPHCQSIDIPAGSYHVAVLGVTMPNNHTRDWMVAQTGSFSVF